MSPKAAKSTQVNSEATENEALENEEESEAPEDEGGAEEIPDPEIEAKKKVAKAGKKAGVKLRPENIIGDIAPPDDPTDRKEVAAYHKRIDKKLDNVLELLKPKKEPAPAPAPEPEKAWYDREIL